MSAAQHLDKARQMLHQTRRLATKHCTLPPTEQLFSSPAWELQELLAARELDMETKTTH